MKRCFTLWLTMLVLATTVGASAQLLAPGELAPRFVAEDIDGNDVALSDLRGKAVVLSFWATWCSTCRDEMVFLDKLSQELGDDVAIIAINAESEFMTKEDKARVTRLVKEWDLGFSVVYDEERKIWTDYGIESLPSSIIVDPKGVVQLSEAYFYTDSAENLAHMLQLISDMMELEKVPQKPEYWYNR